MSENLQAGAVSESVAAGVHGDVEAEVLRRYGNAAATAEKGLCCPTEYDKKYLDLLPHEILEKDYGCGDPSRYVHKGETVLDLGSGAGKICYILAQKVGATGQVIGVDFNDDMLALARKYTDHMAEKLGYANVCFVKARIQDLALDLGAAQTWLDAHPVQTVEQIAAFEAECGRLRREQPLIADDSVDVIVSNCVLNLVRPEDKQQLFHEMFRVLRRGGRAVISDIVCDEDPTPSILADPELWSGCIAGAFREDRFLEMFEQAGFYGVEVLARQEAPWHVIEGIEFRSATVQAFKGKEGPCMERNQAVLYKGPWKIVFDDDGHRLERGSRMAVCDKTYRILTDPAGPFAGSMVGIPPRVEVPPTEAKTFDCTRSALRHPRETKGLEYDATIEGDPCCGPACDC
jgi:SAM-dependent methyltransferase